MNEEKHARYREDINDEVITDLITNKKWMWAGLIIHKTHNKSATKTE